MSSFWSGRRVFVTGCSGLMGGWLVQELLGRGTRIIGLVRDSTVRSRLFTEELQQKMTLVHGSVDDQAALEKALNQHEIDTVFHLAAQAIVANSKLDPVPTFETNIRGTWNLLEACRRTPKVKRVVVASSDKAYGVHSKLPYTEDSPLQGLFPYEVSKSCADLISQAYHHTYKLPLCITRCGNLYGGGDLNFNRIFPGTIRSVYLGERPVIRSDGSMIRDYFYVKDAALAYVTLAEKMDDPQVCGKAFNFSNETQVTVLQLVRLILKVMGRTDLEPVVQNEVSHEIPHQYLSAERARSLLDWKPRYDLEHGLVETVTWYRAYLASQEKGKQ